MSLTAQGAYRCYHKAMPLSAHDDGVAGVVAKPRDKEERPKFTTERRVFSYTTNISAMGKHNPVSRASDLISPWNLKLSPMTYARHSAGAVALGVWVGG